MKVLILLLLLLVPTPKEEKSCLEIDIMLVGDMSGSVDGYQEYVANAMWAFVDRFDLSEASVKIGIVVFGSESTVLTGLTTDKEKLKRIIMAISNTTPSGSTDMDGALYAGATELQYGRKVQKMLVLITDGAPDEPLDAKSAAEEIKKFAGIGVCGTYVGSSAGDLEFLKSICTEHCVAETSFQGLAEELKKLDICL